MSKKSLVSIVIPTFNNEKTLYNCLASIRNQTYKNIEIIVVDSNSTDRTVEIAKIFTKNVIVKNTGMSEARNVGIKKCKGNFIFSVDSDMILEPAVVEDCILKIKDYDALIVPEISFGEDFWSKCKAFERSFYINNELMESPRFFRKSTLKKIDFYDESLLFGEDRDITNKLTQQNFKIGRINSIIMHDEGRLSLLNLWKKYVNYGASFDRYKSKYPLLAKKQVGLRRILLFLSNWKKLLSHPILVIGMIFMLLVQYIAFNYGILKSDGDAI